MNKNTSWGKVAGWYDKIVNADDSYQANVILPNVMRIMVPARGEKILDLGCGQGFFSHALSADGAMVTGIDVGSELLDIAKMHATRNEEFLSASADNLKVFRDKTFDAAISVLAIQNIENMSQAFKEVSRVLKLHGRFVIVLNHPAFRIPGKTSWGFDEKTSTQYRRLDGYLGESRAEIDMHPGTAGKVVTYSFHRPLQVYSKTLANAGLVIARIEEWVSHKHSESGPRKDAEDKARKEIPMFMCLECVKV